MNGGYCMVDLDGLDLAVTNAQTIQGAYEALTDAVTTDKPAVLYNLARGNAKLTPVYAVVTPGEDSYTVAITGATLTVTSDSSITVA